MSEQKMPPFEKYTGKAKEVIRRSHELALERGVQNVNSYHLLTALILQDDSPVVAMLEKMQVDMSIFIDEVLEKIETGKGMGDVMSQSFQMFFTPDLGQIIDRSWNLAQTMKDQYVSVEHLFLNGIYFLFLLKTSGVQIKPASFASKREE